MEGMSRGDPGGTRPPVATMAFPNLDANSHISDTFFGSPFTLSNSSQAQNGVLRNSIFPEWRNGASRGAGESLDEMQKKDPLAAQIWRLYTRTKAQLPNQERMENLTWRMMAMSLKRKEREQQAR